MCCDRSTQLKERRTVFVVIKRNKTSDRELVYIVESYRDENQKIKQRIIKKCGVLSDLLAEDPDAIEKLKEEAKAMTRGESSKEVELTLSLSLPNAKGNLHANYGYLFVESVYRSLKIDRYLERHIEDTALAHRIADALRFFVVREYFISLIDRRQGQLDDPLFRASEVDEPPSLGSLAPLLDISEGLQKHVYRTSIKDSECEDRVASLDITSYYFSSGVPGPSEGPASKAPGKANLTALDSMILVQVGLLFDRFRNPAACVIFPEGEVATPVLLREIARLKKKYGLKKIVITSDRGFGSNSMLGALYNSGNGYVVGIKVKNSTLSLQEKVLDETGYKWNDAGTFKCKAFMSDRIVDDHAIPEKVIAMWTASNAAKMKQRRDKTIVDFLSNPQSYTNSVRPELDKYVRVHDTSHIPDEHDLDHSLFSFDSDLYRRDVELDGYYALATTELDVPETVVIKRYHNLQKIGRALSPPDQDVGSDGGGTWTYQDVRIYFLVAFIAGVVDCKLRKILGNAYESEEIKRALMDAMCKNIGQDIYDIDVKSDVMREIEKAFGVKFDKSYATLEMFRRYRKQIIAALE